MAIASNPRHRLGISPARLLGGLAASVLVAACLGPGATASQPPPSSPSARFATPVSSASPADSVAITDEDESTGGPGPSFDPNATGLPAPSSSRPVAVRLPGEPDPILTPGAINPTVTQATIHSTICVSGWTATIRPSVSFTDALKVRQIGQYGYTDTRMSSYEEDHLISLELGGATSDPGNLWPEPYTIALSDGRSTGAHVKDAFETKLKREVCAGTITLADAQSRIGDYWVHADFGIPLG